VFQEAGHASRGSRLRFGDEGSPLPVSRVPHMDMGIHYPRQHRVAFGVEHRFRFRKIPVFADRHRLAVLYRHSAFKKPSIDKNLTVSDHQIGFHITYLP
jgi:hypothetical protein